MVWVCCFKPHLSLGAPHMSCHCPTTPECCPCGHLRLIFVLLPAARWDTKAARSTVCAGPAGHGRCPAFIPPPTSPVPSQLLERLEGATLGTSPTPGMTHRKLSASLWLGA